MSKKIIFRTILIIIIVLALALLIFFNVSTEVVENVENETVIEPEQEISEEQMRQTSVILYFEDKESFELVKEERKVDVKNLLDNPYMYIVNLLINGTESQNLQNPMPEGT